MNSLRILWTIMFGINKTVVSSKCSKPSTHILHFVFEVCQWAIWYFPSWAASVHKNSFLTDPFEGKNFNTSWSLSEQTFRNLQTKPIPFLFGCRARNSFPIQARGQTRILNQHLWEGDISKLAGGHQNKLFYAFKPSSFPVNSDFEPYAVFPWPCR